MKLTQEKPDLKLIGWPKVSYESAARIVFLFPGLTRLVITLLLMPM